MELKRKVVKSVFVQSHFQVELTNAELAMHTIGTCKLSIRHIGMSDDLSVNRALYR